MQLLLNFKAGSQTAKIKENEANIKKASFMLALGLAKKCRPFDDGVFIKEICQDMLRCFGKDGESMAELIGSVPLSRQTVARRTEEISTHMHECVKKRLQDCKFFSISLDESNDIKNISQVVIYVKTVDESLETHEDFLCLVSMHGHVNGKSLFQAIEERVFSLADKEKLCGVCTDGANVMTGHNIGLHGQFRQNNIHVPFFHCIIHQQSLFAKDLNSSHVMKIAISIINKIRGGHNALRHRKFKQFLEELEADYGDLLLYTEVRWLSRGRSLIRLFSLREEVLEFLIEDGASEHEALIASLKSKDFIIQLAFLTDICTILNELNLLLQGKNKKLFELVPLINCFDRKLLILKRNISNKTFCYMPNTAMIYNETTNPAIIDNFILTIDNLRANLNERFQDFKQLEVILDLHNNTLACDAEKLSPNLKKEIETMLSDISLPNATSTQFWKQIDGTKYPNAKQEIAKLYGMFGATYNCEVAFSIMKLIKSKQRNGLTDEHLEALIRIKCNDDEVDIDEIMSQT